MNLFIHNLHLGTRQDDDDGLELDIRHLIDKNITSWFHHIKREYWYKVKILGS